jgi:superfamily II DNA helicase RecQ
LTGQDKDTGKSRLAGRKVDYKEELSPENFAVFAELREWRKTAAAREAVQLYAVFMNEQLAEMVEKKVMTKDALMEIEGVGKARVGKYGDEVLAVLRKAFTRMETAGEKSEEAVPADCSVRESV